MKALITALGIGLMIGVIRERKHDNENSRAGIRTHALLAILGSLTFTLGIIPFTTTLIIVGAFAVVSYYRTAPEDPGLTGEVTIILTFILAAMTQVNLPLATALGILSAILLKAKSPIHHWSRDVISEQELSEALLILAFALIVMPLLPERPIDPWGVIELTKIWRIVVLIMAMGMFGHIARRALGARLGLPIAGFFSGFASSTAAIASIGQRAKESPEISHPAAASALLANLSSLLLFISIIGTVAPDLLTISVFPLAAAVLSLLVFVIFILFFHRPKKEMIKQNSGQSFKLSHAVIIAVAITCISLLSVWMNHLFGHAGVIIASGLAALAEIHAAGASLAQLASTGGIPLETAEWGMIVVIGASSGAKIVLSFMSGGKKFGGLVSCGLIMMLVAFAIAMIVLK